MKNEGWPAAWLLIPATLIGSIWLFWPIWPFEGREKVYAYPIYCMHFNSQRQRQETRDYEPSGECRGWLSTAEPKLFRIDKVNKEVVEYSEYRPDSHENCDIFDKKNWTCDYWSGNGEWKIEMRDGILIVAHYAFVEYVSEWEFRWHQLKEFFRSS